MYLTEVEMENFKSFNKRIKIPMLEGYTCVTGPNGSGKSNVSDAVLFVLGPKSSRVLRAGRLTDLIFNGGQREKKGARECKVSLTFDNHDRALPIETDEVKLSRVVKISDTAKLPDGGEGYNSYYYINGTKSSLSEFDNLLTQARISADGYNMVQQGDVGKIVSMGNVERRRILESIAGITKFDEDINKAETKKRDVEENLGRIKIIIDEISGQLKQLDKDRGSALKFKTLKEKLDYARAQMAHKNKEMVESEINARKDRMQKCEKELVDLDSEARSLDEEISRVSEELEEIEDRIARRSGDEYRKIRERIDNLKIERARARSTFETSTDELKRLKADKKELQKERDKVDKESAVLGKEKARLEAELKDCEDERKSVVDSIKGIEDNVTKLDSSTLGLQKEILGLNKRVDALEEKLNKLRLDEERSIGLLETARREVAELEETKKTYEFHIQDADYTLKEIKSGINHSQKSEKKLKAELQAKLKREKELGKESVELESAVKTLTLEYNQLKAEDEATRNVELGYTRAVSSILETRDKGTIKGIHGTLAELAQVEDRFEKALNFAAGSRMQAIVVDSDEVASKAIKFIKDKKIGRATFLPLNKMLGGRPSGKALIAVKDAMGFAIDLIKFDEVYRDAFWYALGDTIVVDKLDNARKLMGGVRLVTLDGELVEKSGAMTGGAARTSMVKIGAGKKQIEAVAAKLRDAVARSEKLNDEVKKLKTEIMELESNLKGRELDSDSTKLGPLEAQKKEYKARLKGVLDELSAKSDKIRSLEGEIERIGKEMDSLSPQLDELKKTRDAKKKSFAGFTPQAMAHKLQEEQKAKVELTEKFNGLMSQIETLKAKLDLLAEKRSELDERLETLEEQIKDHENKLKTSHDAEKKSEAELRALQKTDESADKELRDLSSKKEKKYKEKVELESEKGKLLDRLHAKEDFMTNLKVDMQAAENQLKAAEEEIKNYNVEVKGKLPSAEELKKTVLETETMMNALGAVNMKALDDYDEKGKRCKELEDELAELRGQKNKLNALVRALGDKKKSGLLSVFEKINQNFKAVYSEISDGGDAELVLEDMEDPFQGGLIIKAKPRNKKVMRLEALSGGEKSLVSMAFIFAIQEYEPSPFYLLDEIDQNLDALNAEKVARMIRHNSETAQFIQISLRKITLKEADHVVGVTMDEDSTSKVVMKVSLTDVPDEKVEANEEEMANAEGA